MPASWPAVSTAMPVLCTPELFPPFRRACALCSSEFNVKIHSTDPNIELNEPIKLLGTTAVLTKPAFSHAAAIRPVATLGGRRSRCSQCRKPRRIEPRERMFVRFTHLSVHDAPLVAARCQDGRTNKTPLCLPVLPPLAGNAGAMAWQVWRNNDEHIVCKAVHAPQTTTMSESMILLEYADNFLDCGIDDFVEPGAEMLPCITQMCARCLTSQECVFSTNAYLCESCWRLEAEAQCQCQPHLFCGHSLVQAQAYVESLPQPGRRAAESMALENWTLSFNPAHGLASSIPLRLPPARHNFAATYVQTHIQKLYADCRTKLGDARAGQVLKAMAALQDSESTVTHFDLMDRLLEEDRAAAFLHHRDGQYLVVFDLLALCDDSIKHVIKAHEAIVFDRMKELLATEEQERLEQERRAAQRRERNRRKRRKRKERRETQASGPPEPPSSLHPTPAPEPQHVDIKPLTTDNDENLCVICMEAVRGYAPTSCGHRHFCHGCSAMLQPGTPCPSCRVPIASWVRIHN